MKRFLVVMLLIFVGVAGWRAGGVLSSDAMSMAVGIVFGVLASLPASLLILAATRRAATPPPAPPPSVSHPGQAASGFQQPIVLVAPPAYPAFGPAHSQANQPAGYAAPGWPQPYQPARPQRSFTIVGEQAELVDDF